MARRIEIPHAPVFTPLWTTPARYKGVYGGRGSGKSHDRAAHLISEMLAGHRCVGCREVQNTVADSIHQLLCDKITDFQLNDLFHVTDTHIRAKEHVSTGSVIYRGLRSISADNIRSLEGATRLLVEEAQTISHRSLKSLTPTIRAPGAELWFVWNPRYASDPVDALFRGPVPPTNSVLVNANWQDNPHFPPGLREELEADKARDLVYYRHVWEGAYEQVTDGAYYAEALARVYLSGRCTPLPIEAEALVHTGWDIGVDDQTAIWAAQIVGREVRIIDYYEGRGHDAAHYARWVRDNNYDSGIAFLPHDGKMRERGSARTYEDYLRDAGISRITVLPQTKDLMAAIQRIRSFLSRCWFRDGAEGIERGLEVLGAYRVEWNDKLRTPKPTPVHDWASHGADAFRTLENGLSTIADINGDWGYDRNRDINTGRIKSGAVGVDGADGFPGGPGPVGAGRRRVVAATARRNRLRVR